MAKNNSKFSRQEIKEIWQTYKRTQDEELRESLILYYSPLVKYVAGRISSTLPKSVDVQDLISNGIIGLIDAIKKFNPERDIKFETYAISRIRGSIIDSLRALDWLPRSLRYRAKEIDRAYANLESKLKRPPDEDELAEELNMSIEELRDTLSQLSYSTIIGLEDIVTTNQQKNASFEIKQSVEDDKAINPSELFEDAELKESLLKAVKSLPERERKVIVHYYYSGLTLKEIGKILDVSESRVSQIHSRAILRLKSNLKGTITV